MYTAPPGAERDSYSTSRCAVKRIDVWSRLRDGRFHAAAAVSLHGRRGLPSVQCGVISPRLDLEAGAGERVATLERQSGERRHIACRAEPEHARRTARWEGAELIQHDIEGRGTGRDRLQHLERGCSALRVDGTEEVHRQVERLGASPAHALDAFFEPIL